jgi:DNA primase
VAGLGNEGVEHLHHDKLLGLGKVTDAVDLLLEPGRGSALAFGPHLQAQELVHGHAQHLGEEGKHGGRKAQATALVVGEGLLGDAQAVGDLLLGEVLVFPGLGDACTQGFEESLVLAVHGNPDRRCDSHEDKLQFFGPGLTILFCGVTCNGDKFTPNPLDRIFQEPEETMARIPESELERLKAEVSVERLVEASGIVLTKSNKDRLGKCPFHEDREASLVVTPAKNLFHCFGCGAAGGPIDWVIKTRGVSFRHAVELLRTDLSLVAGPVEPLKVSHVRRLPSPVAFDADDQALLNQTMAHYHANMQTAPEALAYLKARGIDHPEAIERFQIGFSNRTLGLTLPNKHDKAGADIRGRLERVGIFRATGHEHFAGSLVIPVIDEAGNVREAYARKIRDDLRTGTPTHLYLPGPHHGVWNVAALQEHKEIILCEALIDALTFWCAGFCNVTAAYGVEGFTSDHLEAFRRYGTERVLIAFDRDEAGDRAAGKLAQKLAEEGIASYRILFPKGMDANAYALKVRPAAKTLGLAIRTAEWMAGGTKDENRPLERLSKDEATPKEPGAEGGLPSLAAVPGPPERLAPPLEPAPLPASVKPPAPGDAVAPTIQGQDLFLTLEDRQYRVRGWDKPLNPEFLKVNLMVAKGGRFHVDTLDQAKARTAFVKQAGQELAEAEDTLKADLGRLLRTLEAVQAEHLAEVLAARNPQGRPPMSEAEHAEALSLLRSPDLMQRILRDFEALGVVGEEPNKLTGYLAAVSRLLDRPLALLIQSGSAAGKSSLMDAVLDLVPGEDVIRYSAMSGQSLFYMGDRTLQHKVLAIAEEEGARQAAYALKILQSEGRVTMASTGKDPGTGMLVTHDYTVEGPVMLFLTTTAIDLDEELLNRCLVLTVNESREQTRAIHVLQRQRETLEGLLAKSRREDLLKLHRNAQRLLTPLAVVNPYAAQLSFRDDQTRSRRDHVKYLTLIRSIALLHQYQRDIKTHGELRYIEVTPEDVALANELAQEVFSRTVDELLPQTRKLLTLLHGWVRESCEREGLLQSEFHFTRRQAREAIGWGDTQLKVHLGRLAELEFLVAHRGRQGQAFDYELLYQGEDATGRAHLLGLIDCGTLQPAPTTATSRGEAAHFAGGGRGSVGPWSAGGRGVVGVQESAPGLGLEADPGSEGGNGGTVLPFAPVASYAPANGKAR